MTISRLIFLFSNVCLAQNYYTLQGSFPQAANKEILLGGGIRFSQKQKDSKGNLTNLSSKLFMSRFIWN